MNIKAIHKNARMSPQKLRALSRILKGLPVERARQQLQYAPGKAAVIIREVLQSAVANASHNYSLEAKDLVVRDIMINAGFVMKRIMPVSRGMAHPILKRTAHVTVVVGEAEAKKRALKARKSEITEISAQEFAERGGTDHVHDEEEVKETAEKATHEQGPKTDKSMEAFQKTKMMQQGGDKKKTHRRKSLSGK